MSSPGAERDPARPSHDPMFEDPSESPSVLRTPVPPAPSPRPARGPQGLVPPPPEDEAETPAAEDDDADTADAAAADAAAAIPASPTEPPALLPEDAASAASAAAAAAVGSASASAGVPAGPAPGPAPYAPPTGAAAPLAPPARPAPAVGSAVPAVDSAVPAVDSAVPAADAGPAVPPAPAAGPPRVDTGRLFRSTTADGPATSDAIPALTPDQLRGLRSVAAPDGARSPLPGAAAGGAAAGGAIAAAGIAAGQPAPGASSPDGAADPGQSSRSDGARAAGPVPVPPPFPQGDRARGTARDRSTLTYAGSTGLTATGVWVVTVGVTVLLAFADALLPPKGLSWMTGLGLVFASVYCALTVRRDDLWIAVIAPPLAYLAAVLTAGQLTLSGAGGFLVREAVMVFSTLSFNAPWILGSTAAALVIVLIRRRPTGARTP